MATPAPGGTDILRQIGGVLRRPMVAAVLTAAVLSTILAVVALAPLDSAPEAPPPTTVALAAPVVDTAAPDQAAPAIDTAAPDQPDPSTEAPPLGPTVTPPAAQAPAPTGTSRPTATARPTDPSEPTAEPEPTRTPKPRPTRTPRPKPTATEPAPAYAAEGADLVAWTGPSWSAAGPGLVHDGSIYAQPWATGPYRAPSAAYAVEAELRLVAITPGYCSQSFGVVAGGGGGIVWGGGAFFPCDGKPRARIADVANTLDGYFGDRDLGGDPFDPGDGWHTYRLEVRGNKLRLLVDGKPLAEATDPNLSPALANGDEVGFWSEGVQVELRRVAVFEIEDEVE